MIEKLDEFFQCISTTRQVRDTLQCSLNLLRETGQTLLHTNVSLYEIPAVHLKKASSLEKLKYFLSTINTSPLL